jgi:hypothetical protein
MAVHATGAARTVAGMQISTRIALTIVACLAALSVAAVAASAAGQPTGTVAFQCDELVSFCLVNPDGSNRRDVVFRDPRPDHRDPYYPLGGDTAVSPDGSAVAVAVGASDFSELWLVNPDGSDPRLLVHQACGCGNDHPLVRWFPDGRHLAFYDGRSALNDVQLDGSRRVMFWAKEVSGFSIAPNGRRIVLETIGCYFYVPHSIRDIEASTIIEATIDPNRTINLSPVRVKTRWRGMTVFTSKWKTRGVRELTHNSKFDCSGAIDLKPDYSADGKRIVWQTYNVIEKPRRTVVDVWLMNADGSHKRRLVHRPNVGVGDTDAIFVGNDRVLFNDHEGRFYTVNLDGRDRRQITNGECCGDLDQAPSWSPAVLP